MWDDDEVIVVATHCDPLDVIIGTPYPVQLEIVREYKNYTANVGDVEFDIPRTQDMGVKSC